MNKINTDKYIIRTGTYVRTGTYEKNKERKVLDNFFTINKRNP